MHSSVWGAYCWKILHQSAYLFEPTEIEKIRTKAFYRHIQRAIPCGVCQHHFNNLISHPRFEKALVSRDAFINWTVDSHNEVNKRLSKPFVERNQANKLYGNIDKNALGYLNNLMIFLRLFTKGKAPFKHLSNIVGYIIHHFPHNVILNFDKDAFNNLLKTKNNKELLGWAHTLNQNYLKKNGQEKKPDSPKAVQNLLKQYQIVQPKQQLEQKLQRIIKPQQTQQQPKTKEQQLEQKLQRIIKPQQTQQQTQQQKQKQKLQQVVKPQSFAKRFNNASKIRNLGCGCGGGGGKPLPSGVNENDVNNKWVQQFLARYA